MDIVVSKTGDTPMMVSLPNTGIAPIEVMFRKRPDVVPDVWVNVGSCAFPVEDKALCAEVICVEGIIGYGVSRLLTATVVQPGESLMVPPGILEIAF